MLDTNKLKELVLGSYKSDDNDIESSNSLSIIYEEDEISFVEEK